MNKWELDSLTSVKIYIGISSGIEVTEEVVVRRHRIFESRFAGI
jgi:hypothetical protein